jgi:hypothetical protein
MEDQLRSIYYDPKIGFTNLNLFYERVKEAKLKIPYKTVKEFYNNQSINQIYKHINKHEERSSIISFAVGNCLQCDLMVITKFKSKNSNYKYLLNIIDVNSRYAWVYPVKSKGAKEISEHIESVYKELINNKNELYSLTTDDGTEFDNKILNSINKKYNVKHYIHVSKNANHPTKTAIVERFNYTLWKMISKYTESKDTLKFIDVLKDLVNNYNSRIHTGIKAKPYDVYHKKALPNTIVNIAVGYKLGDIVRVKQKRKTVGAKSYDITYSRQKYEIVKVNGSSHTLKNIETNRELSKQYQSSDLQKINDDKIISATNKANDIIEITKQEKTKRKNRKDGLDVNDKGDIIIPKRLIPKKSKR